MAYECPKSIGPASKVGPAPFMRLAVPLRYARSSLIKEVRRGAWRISRRLHVVWVDRKDMAGESWFRTIGFIYAREGEVTKGYR